MKSLTLLALGIVLAGPAVAQQAPPTKPTCVSQYLDAPDRTPAGLLAGGYDIKAAVTGGLWIQKDREVFYCNTGRIEPNRSLCWQLREPGPGGIC